MGSSGSKSKQHKMKEKDHEKPVECTCVVCKKEMFIAAEEAAKTGGAAVCHKCRQSGQGRRLGGAEGNEGTPPTNGIEEERERRAQAVEARMRAKYGAGGAAQTRPKPPSQQQQPPAPITPSSAPTVAAAATTASPAPNSGVSAVSGPSASCEDGGGDGAASNPVLEAALRRKQANQPQEIRPPGRNTSAEKTQLLHEINAILRAHNEEPPFGLASSDEVKLRGYLKYVKEKYNLA